MRGTKTRDMAENREPLYCAVHCLRRYLLRRALTGVLALLSVLVALASDVCFVDSTLHREGGGWGGRRGRLWHLLGVLRKMMLDVVTRTVRQSVFFFISVQIAYGVSYNSVQQLCIKRCSSSVKIAHIGSVKLHFRT